MTNTTITTANGTVIHLDKPNATLHQLQWGTAIRRVLEGDDKPSNKITASKDLKLIVPALQDYFYTDNYSVSASAEQLSALHTSKKKVWSGQKEAKEKQLLSWIKGSNKATYLDKNKVLQQGRCNRFFLHLPEWFFDENPDFLITEKGKPRLIEPTLLLPPQVRHLWSAKAPHNKGGQRYLQIGLEHNFDDLSTYDFYNSMTPQEQDTWHDFKLVLANNKHNSGGGELWNAQMGISQTIKSPSGKPVKLWNAQMGTPQFMKCPNGNSTVYEMPKWEHFLTSNVPLLKKKPNLKEEVLEDTKQDEQEVVMFWNEETDDLEMYVFSYNKETNTTEYSVSKSIVSIEDNLPSLDIQHSEHSSSSDVVSNNNNVPFSEGEIRGLKYSVIYLGEDYFQGSLIDAKGIEITTNSFSNIDSVMSELRDIRDCV